VQEKRTESFLCCLWVLTSDSRHKRKRHPFPQKSVGFWKKDQVQRVSSALVGDSKVVRPQKLCTSYTLMKLCKGKKVERFKKLTFEALSHGSHSFYTANTPCLPLLRKRSPDGATTDSNSTSLHSCLLLAFPFSYLTKTWWDGVEEVWNLWIVLVCLRSKKMEVESKEATGKPRFTGWPRFTWKDGC